MRAIVPRANIFHLHKNLPQQPEDHVDFWSIWRAEIGRILPMPATHVFASEPYVFRLAQEIGAQPVIIDPDRRVFPVSGSDIRTAPHAHWPMIPAAVRPHYQRRVTLLGPESVGKTRLSLDLAREFSTLAAPEYGRDYDVFYKSGAPWRAEDLVDLAITHRAMREALEGDAGPLLIEDTDAVQTAVWSRHLIGGVADALAALERDTLADHYLLLAPDVAWIEDGTRYAGDRATREFFFAEAQARLTALGASFDIVSGNDFDKRRLLAIDLIVRKFGDLRPSTIRRPN